ncbi:organomercurial lyase [Nocardia sp. NPDC020380]|uniref:organomercurial lyase n=1 Tax=Nocardia sp. NPDC020380 TaxID=3364309 RepID=UPI00379F0F62
MGRRTAAKPSTIVVFIGALAADGTAAETCCGYLNFFAGRDSAQIWANQNREISGTIVDLADAHRLGVEIFGRLLRS